LFWRRIACFGGGKFTPPKHLVYAKYVTPEEINSKTTEGRVKDTVKPIYEILKRLEVKLEKTTQDLSK
jgi:hypothetical protein